ncbi:MAG: leucine--tRNA ligase [Crocinitomicaceae bacterium]|nr:leucine--tRNA ligase [Crocinitomicaceae bacterium]
MEYDFKAIETKWRAKWAEQGTYLTEEVEGMSKFYVLDMFPYPSGAGLHVGHPLGYIASDVIARYKRQCGFNVLHPQGYDSFGLPAEQYAIQTGQHPAVTTERNIERYRSQLDLLGFSYDWSREVRTSSPEYYRWTQWIFARLFEHGYDNAAKKARPISDLTSTLESKGNDGLGWAVGEDTLKDAGVEAWGDGFDGTFSAAQWNGLDPAKKGAVLMAYRLAYLADSEVNWCPALGTVLANDEVVGGLSERGGHPVVRKKMCQWMMRITAYADRLLEGLDTIDWSDSIKEVQRNWIGKSTGAQLRFAIQNHADLQIEVFSTRPDTLYGANFLVLAPEHDLVTDITTEAQRKSILAYQKETAARSERERMAGDRGVTGCFTGAHAVHPLTGDAMPIWIADYVLAGYGTGAVMAVPAGDQRDWEFAKAFELPIPAIFEGHDIDTGAQSNKQAVLCKSGKWNGMTCAEALPKAIEETSAKGIASPRVNFRLRDAVFSRQRYWGEPFPICYVDGIPQLIEDEQVLLPDVDAYLPTEDGDPPLARAAQWNVHHGDRMEYNTMPGWAGSSWYFLRYMDPHNSGAFCDRAKSDYWGQVDLYVGGAEHATGHLLYSRFWTKFLFDLNLIGFEEPFAKMINQGMILGRSSFVYRIEGTNRFVSFEQRKEHRTQRLHVDISLVRNDILDLEGFKAWRPEFANADFLLNEAGEYRCGNEVEKMSKSKFNVENPDDLVDRYGADTLRCYEMFLGPLEQAKPWDTQGISGVHGFLRKLNRLYRNADGHPLIVDTPPSPEANRALHKTIKKVTEDLDRFSWNTVVSALMIGVNELTEANAHERAVLQPLSALLAPYAPHLAEDLWEVCGGEGSVVDAPWPKWDAEKLVEAEVTYPVQFNGKVRFQFAAPAEATPNEVETMVLADDRTAKQLQGRTPKKVIVVPRRIINIVG